MRRLLVIVFLLNFGLIVVSTSPSSFASSVATSSNDTTTSSSLKTTLAKHPQLQQAYAERIGQEDINYHVHTKGQNLAISNPKHGYDAIFTEQGVQLQVGRDSLQIELIAYGYGENLRPAQVSNIQADNNKLTYERENLSEWYLNSQVGLQQGFTIESRLPHNRIDNIILQMKLSGTMQANLRENALHLYGEHGANLTYRGLYVYDAIGQQLPAELDLTDNQLQILVDDHIAVYPITIDPWIQQQKLTASDPGYNDFFGRSVAISSDTAVIGAYEDDGIGSVYVFVRSGPTWSQQQKLTASDAAAGDNFGLGVAVDGDTIVIGAYGNDDNGSNSGSAYVFVRSGSTWSQQQKLTASDAAADDKFGYLGVAINGDTAIVGAFTDDDIAVSSGSAYVFVRSGSTWSQQQKLTASDPGIGDWFGYSLALDGDTAVIGAYGDDDRGTDSGSAYVFVRSGSTWSQQQKLLGSDTNTSHQFGFSVDIDVDTVIISAHYDNHAGIRSGAAYVFVRNGSIWFQQQKITANDTDPEDSFGVSVAVEGDLAIIGAYQDDDVASNTGAVYVFMRNGINFPWSEQQKLTANDGSNGDLLGLPVAINGNTIVAGAFDADVPSDPFPLDGAGAAYIFTLIPAGVTLSTDSVNVSENNTSATLSITLDTVPTVDVTVDVAFSIGSPYGVEISSPVAPYVIPSGTQGPLTLTIVGLDDTLYEGNHNDVLTLSVSSSDPNYNGSGVLFSGGGGMNNNEVTANITDNDPQPIVSISPASIIQIESNSGTITYDFIVTLSAPVGPTVTVDYSTNDDTATVADDDYIDNDSTLMFNFGDPLSQHIIVLANGDTQYEPNEDFIVALNSATNVEIDGVNNNAIGTINNDDTEPVVSVSPSEFTQIERDVATSAYDIKVKLSNGSYEVIQVTYSTSDGTATVADGDYIDNDSVLVFTPGDSLIQNVQVLSIADTEFEAHEDFIFTIDSTTNSTIDVAKDTYTGTIANDDVGPNDGIILFDPSTARTGLYDSVQNDTTEFAFINSWPSYTDPIWVMGDWDGDGDKTPGFFDGGVFRYTNYIGFSSNWTTGMWLGNAPGRVAVVAGRYASGSTNDCIGWIDSNTSPVTGDLRFSLKWTCNMFATGAVPLNAQWLGAPLGDSGGFTGTFQFAYGDWDNDGFDEPGIRRGSRIVKSNSAPSEGVATYPAGSAQRWDTADGDGPGAHGLNDGLFVAGDWNGDGVDTWGVVYNDDTFYYRDVFGFNPGPFAFASQTFTSSIATPRQVDSHHNASGGSSAPGPALPSILAVTEAGTVDTSHNVEANLSVSKTGNYKLGEVGLVGDSIVWTITVVNTGTAPADGVQITDNVPSELRLDDTLTDTGTVTIQGQNVTFTVERIDIGETVRFQVVTTILEQSVSGQFANSVNVLLPDGNGNGSDANLLTSGTVNSVDGLPTTGYIPRFRW